jgi:hypothetical protein
MSVASAGDIAVLATRLKDSDDYCHDGFSAMHVFFGVLAPNRRDDG